MTHFVKKLASLTLLTALAVLAAASQTFASHYRGGDIYATIDANGVVTIIATTRWRKDAGTFGIDPTRFGATSLNPFTSICTATNFSPPAGQTGGFRIIRVSDGAVMASLPTTAFTLAATTIATDTTPANYNQVTQELKLPLGTTAVTGQISLPLNLANGTYDLVWNDWSRIVGIQNIDPTDPCGGNNSGFSLSTRVIKNGTANGSPQVNSSFAPIVVRGLDYSQNLNASDPNNDSIIYQFAGGTPPNALYPDFAGVSRVPGLTLSQTGQLEIPAASTTPLLDNAYNPTSGGDYLMKVEMIDSKGAISQRDALIDVVTTTNRAPVLEPIGNVTIDAGTTVTFIVHASDPDAGQTMTLSGAGLPAGASFPSATGPNGLVLQTFSWTPTLAQTGTFSIKFDATDSGTSALSFLDKITSSRQVTITVQDGNRPPVLQTIANRRVGADPLAVQTFQAETLEFDAFATDPNSGDTLTFSVPILLNPSGTNVPLANLGVVVTNGVLEPGHVEYAHITVTPGPEDVGVWQMRVRVDDGEGGSNEANVFITVGTFANQSPFFSHLPQTDLIVSTGALVSFPVTAQDPNAGQSVTFSSTGRPAGSTFGDGSVGNPLTGTFTWTPGTDQTGDYTINFDATDNGSPNISQRAISRIHVVSGCPAVPRIIRLTPAIGLSSGGTSVTMFGQGFCATPGPVSVTVGGNPVQDLVITSSVQLSFKTPLGTTNQAADVVVTTPSGTATLVGGFWYYTKVAQTITFPFISTHVIGDAPFALGATATSGLPVSYAVSGPATILDGMLTVTGIGSVTVTASQQGDLLTLPADAVVQTFTVEKAPVNVVVTCGPGLPYTGSPQTPCSATATGVGLSLSLTVTYANNTGAGTATAAASFAESATHKSSSDSEDFTIAKAATATVVTCAAGGPYAGTAQTPCTAQTTRGATVVASPEVTYTNNTNAGTATATATFVEDLNHFGSDDTETFTIAKAATATLVTCTAGGPYTGTAQTPCTAQTTRGTTVVASPPVTYTNNTNAGTATASAAFAEDANHLGSSDTETFTIAKAATTTLVTCAAGLPYTGSAQTPCTAQTTRGTTVVASPAVTYINNTNAGTATATAAFAEDANHNASGDSKTFTIAKATPVIAWATPAAINLGTALSAIQLNATASVPGTFVYSPPAGTLLGPGAQLLSVLFTPADAANFTAATASVTINVNVTGSVNVGPGQTVTFSGGTISNQVTVNGGTLILTNGTQVGGNLTLNSGSLVTSDSTIGGNLKVNGGTFAIGTGTVITGNLLVENLPVSTVISSVCGAQVQGNLSSQNNAAPVTIGSPLPACAGNLITGHLQINTNVAPVQVFGNTVSKNLQCSGNSAIAGGTNTASQKQGQCSSF